MANTPNKYPSASAMHGTDKPHQLSQKQQLDYEVLRKISFTKAETLVYAYLAEFGMNGVMRLSKDLHISRMQTYRALSNLGTIGFVTKIKVGSLTASFKAVYLNTAMANYAEYQRSLVAALIKQQRT